MKSSTKQDKIISTVMDNLKTPTIAQIKALELFLNTTSKKINTEEKDLIRLTLNSCNDMQKMIENFVLISKLSSEKLNLEYKYFDLAKLVEDILKESDVLIKYSGYKVNFQAENNIEIYADEQKIKKATENLISHILNSAFKNSEIIINLNHFKNNVRLEIISNGINNDYKEILQIFKQEQIYNPKYSGLYIAKEIIKAHFGKIMFEATEENMVIGYCIPAR